MAKRDADAILLVSSDDDADKTYSLSSRRRSKPNVSLLTRSEPSRRKKPRVSGSASRRLHQRNDIDEFQFFGEDFKDVFTGVKVSAGFIKSEKQELWVDKYKPSCLEELAVHKKKVDEVKAWVEGKITPNKNTNGDYVLLITGQAGVGKSATVRCIASLLGATLFEWNTPTPTVWQEHIYCSNAGTSYTSKLEEFEMFVEKVRNYGLLSPGLAGRSSSPGIVLIDDLPLAFGKIACRRLQNCLQLLVQFSSAPTIILITDCDRSDSADDTARHLEELRLFLENAGAYKIAFNPITNNSIKKTLSRICRQEQCNVIAEQLDIIATASGGDIRQAITSLQLSCSEADRAPSSSRSDYTCASHEQSPSGRFTSHFGRDETLSLFHALGKFLHNKRETECTGFHEDLKDAFPIRDKYRRLPLKMDSPEKVLHQAHGQARPIAEFLHENAIDFIDVDAIDDAWTVLSYLVDADVLLNSSHRTFGRGNDTESVLQSVAASIATRGVLYGNCHPSPSRWHSIRKPKLWQVEKSLLYNKDQMVRQRDVALFQGCCSYDLAVFASEYLPVSKQQIHCKKVTPPVPVYVDEEDGMMLGDMETRGDGVDDDSMATTTDGTMLEDSERSDDEIEDW